MAESTLSLSRTDLLAELGHYARYGRTSGSWSAAQSADLEAWLKAGLRQFLFPQPAHEWSFLNRSTTLSLSAPYSTGTIAVTNGSTTVTLTTGTWPSGAADAVLFVAGNPSYDVATRSSGSVILLDTAWTGTTASGLSYVLGYWDYEMPDDFGGFNGPLTYAARTGYPDLSVTDEYRIRSYRAANGMLTGVPEAVALRPSSTTPSTESTRFTAMFDRAPAAAETLTYRYTILPDALTSTNYPYGGMPHAETILASCLAVIEERKWNNPRGPKWTLFMDRLAASIAHDSQRVPDVLGYMGDCSDDLYENRRERFSTFPTMTYDT